MQEVRVFGFLFRHELVTPIYLKQTGVVSLRMNTKLFISSDSFAFCCFISLEAICKLLS